MMTLKRERTLNMEGLLAFPVLLVVVLLLRALVVRPAKKAAKRESKWNPRLR